MMPPASSDRMRRTRTVRVWSSMCTDSHSPRRANRVGVSCANGHAERLVSESGLLLLCRVTSVFLYASGKMSSYGAGGRRGGGGGGGGRGGAGGGGGGGGGRGRRR